MRHGMIGAAAALALLGGAAWAAEDWPFPQDIPKPGPVAVGLAGAPEPDLVRHFSVRGPLGDAKIAPDGRTVAYRHEMTGVAQVYALDLESGRTRQLSFGRRVSGFDFSPAGEILLSADRDGDEREGYTIISVDGMKERLARERSDAFLSFGDWSSDGQRFAYASTERNGDDFDIFVAGADSSAPKEVYRGRYGNSVESWRPGADQLIVSETRGEDAADVYLLDLASGKRTPLFKPKVASAYSGFAWKPDGSGFYLATNQGREFAALAYYDMARKRLSIIEAPEADVEEVALFGKGRYLAWTTNEGGYSRLHLRDLESGQDLSIPALPEGGSASTARRKRRSC